MTTTPATAKQIAFLTTLFKERVAPADIRHAEGILSTFSTKEASRFISTLLAAPRKPVAPAKPIEGVWGQVNEALRSIPAAKYALAWDEDMSDLFPSIRNAGNDFLFVEVRAYGKRIYMSHLHGAPGYFTRTKFRAGDQIALVKFIAPKALELSKKFSEVYTCCGACAAPLTDKESRELGFGPDCRKKFGL